MCALLKIGTSFYIVVCLPQHTRIENYYNLQIWLIVVVQLKQKRVAFKKIKNQKLHFFFQDNKKCFIYFHIKYRGRNYGCHCINPGRAERQSWENLFSCRHTAMTCRAHGYVHILLKKLEATAEVSSFSFVPVFTNRKLHHEKTFA